MDTQNYAAHFYSCISNEIDLLEKNTEEYPASSVARFMWLYHLKKNNDPRFEKVAKQTGIYLNNPLWMDYQLSKSEIAGGPANARLNESFGQEQISENFISENEPAEFKNEEIISESFQEIENENTVDFTEQKTDEEIVPSIVNARLNESFGQEQISENLISENGPAEFKNEEIISEPSQEIENENTVGFNEQKTDEEIVPSIVNAP